MVRYNNSIYAPEVYAGGGWQSLPTVLAQRYVSVSHTSDTNETSLATITIPANTMSANACLRVRTLWETTNNADSKTLYVRFSATSGAPNGTAFIQGGAVNTSSFRIQAHICNQNATNAQIGAPAGLTGFGTSTSSPVTATDHLGEVRGSAGDTLRAIISDVPTQANLDHFQRQIGECILSCIANTGLDPREAKLERAACPGSVNLE